ncbi:MAG: hypothetical protein R2751_13855 [Bacteroidales bacterium]
MDNVKDIQHLLERFYNGETSLDEEKRLEEYFRSGEVPEPLHPDRNMFLALLEEKEEVRVPKDLNKNILETIDKAYENERRTRRITLYSLSGLAAGLLILIALYLGYLREDAPRQLASAEMQDTFQDPQLAYEEAMKTLAYVSAKLNDGTRELQVLKEASEAAAQPLENLNKIQKGSKELSLLGQLSRTRVIN